MNGNSGKTKTIIWVTLLLLVVVLGIGYAAISTIQLRIEGSASADPNQTNFKVEFTGSPTVSTPSNVEATINPSNKLLATMNVTGLTSKGDKETATFTIQNLSEDLSAQLTVGIENSNEEYYKVTYDLKKGTLTAGETTTIEVTIELIKTPIEDIPETNIGVTLTATPTQPNE